jgi:exodeoxyribonuclease VII small subunit
LTKAATTRLNFESALKELETLVASMEKGELSLEDSLKAFERGVVLSRQCRDLLQKAEQRLMVLDKGSNSLQDLVHDD